MPARGPTEKGSNVNGMKAYCSKFRSTVVRYRLVLFGFVGFLFLLGSGKGCGL